MITWTVSTKPRIKNSSHTRFRASAFPHWLSIWTVPQNCLGSSGKCDPGSHPWNTLGVCGRGEVKHTLYLLTLTCRPQPNSSHCQISLIGGHRGWLTTSRGHQVLLSRKPSSISTWLRKSPQCHCPCGIVFVHRKEKSVTVPSPS